MIKKNISSFELAALIKELQVMVDGKISQIYHPEKKELMFQLHVRNEGKKILRVIPGKFLNFTSEKKSVLRPSGFCMQLRKYLNNSIIREVYQKDSERIVIIVLETAEYSDSGEKSLVRYNLLVEFFSKGNVLITDSDWNIIGTLSLQRWEARTIKNREVYKFPPACFDWKNSEVSIVEEIVKTSDKKNLATCLATELSLGGVFAEEVCKYKKIDPGMELSKVSPEDVVNICKGINEYMSAIEAGETKGYIFEDGSMFPLRFIGVKVADEFETYSECLDLVDPFETISPYQQKINSIQRIISGQEEAIKQAENGINKNTVIGDLIYSKYIDLNSFLSGVNQIVGEKTWAEIKNILMRQDKIKKVDLKTKKVIINL